MLDEQEAPAVDESQESVVETTPVVEVEPGEPANPALGETSIESELTSPETPEPEPIFRLPGQTDQPVNEADWLRQQYAQMAQQYQAVQQQLQEMQFKDLPEEDRAAALQQQEVNQLKQYVEQIQQQQALQEWRNYWAQFVPDAAPILAEVDPIKMGHHVASTLVKQANDLRSKLAIKDAEITALKKAVGVPQPGPQVTTGGQGSTVRPTFRDLIKDTARFDALMRKAAMGTLQESEIPPLQ